MSRKISELPPGWRIVAIVVTLILTAVAIVVWDTVANIALDWLGV